MISKSNPEDSKRYKAITITRFIVFVLIAAWLIYACCNAWRQVKAPERSPDQILEDTLKISREKMQEDNL